MLPRWDLTPFFPSLDSAEFRDAFETVPAELQALEGFFDKQGIGAPHPSRPDAGSFEAVVNRLNATLERVDLVSNYLSLHVTTDSYDETAQAMESEFQMRTRGLATLVTRFRAWVGDLDLECLLEESAVAREHEYALRKAQVQARHLMGAEAEALAVELGLSGGAAWSKLHGNISSRLTVSVPLEGQDKALPMSMVRNLAYDPDRAVRRRAYEAELAGWKSVEVPLAAALNGVKGESGALVRKRGWSMPLAPAIFESNIDEPTLEAMLGAARESFPTLRRYLRAKARLLGLERLAWYDLFAPIAAGGRQWSYEEGERFVADQFARYSPKMSELALRSARERWVDAEPREGKRDGAYCMPMRRAESRIMMNFKPSFGSVNTLAHELGHAYHNLCLAERTPLQRATPMTLAETASIFCETVVRQAALQQGTPQERLDILEASLQGGSQIVLDITSRFLFERGVFERRAERDLSPAEMCELMLQAQRETYGDGLDDSLLHPYMWAVKPHYYGSDFYNFPYMFGLLFGLGLYARYREEPEGFQARYDDLLSRTGLADARTLAGEFGIDLASRDFWAASLATIGEDVEQFVNLANEQAPMARGEETLQPQ
jgi:oligoendopeptidase F